MPRPRRRGAEIYNYLQSKEPTVGKQGSEAQIKAMDYWSDNLFF